MRQYVHILCLFTISSFTIAQIPNRAWSTYHGGTDEDSFRDMAIDATGNIYVIGSTHSPTAIATNGSYQPNPAGESDAFIAKYDRDGIKVWSTYFGGSADDFGQSIDLDAAGNVFITGLTFSTNGIATTGTHQTVNNGNGDTFIAKFTNNGTKIWGSYLGGENFDFSNDIEIDIAGNPIIIGWTNSATNISTAGAFQTTFRGPDDVLFAKFNTNGQLLWCTYFGDNGFDTGLQVESDGSGNIVISGWTSSTTNIASPGAIQPIYGGNTADVFLSVFGSNGNRLWSTYYGGSGNDYGDALFVNNTGEIYLSGSTNSPNNIATPTAFQSNVAVGYDAFLSKFNINGARIWSTYFGGNGDDTVYRLREATNGGMYMVGYTTSTDVMATPGANQQTKSGSQDVFFTRFENNGTRTWSTYYGGGANDFGYGLVIDANNDIFICGTTEGSNNLATFGAVQVSYGGGTKDGFVTKFSPCTPLININPTSNSPVCAGSTLSLMGIGGVSYQWQGPNGFTSTNQSISINNVTTSAAGNYMVTVTDSRGCTGTSMTTVVINQQSSGSVSSNSPVCFGSDVILTATGGTQYQWSGPNNFTSSIANPIITHASSDNAGSYLVTVTDAGGCMKTAVLNVMVTSQLNVPISSNSPVCAGAILSLMTSGGNTYRWSGPNGFTNTSPNPNINNPTALNAGTYVLTVTASNGCTASTSTDITVNPGPIAIVSSNSPVCNGGNLALQLSGGLSYQWQGPNNFTSTLQNPDLSNLTAANIGTYAVTVTGQNGCTTTTSTSVNVTGQLNVTVTSNSPICEGDTLRLIANGGVAFIWNGPNGFNATSRNLIIPASNSTINGNYILTVSDVSGCTGTRQVSVVIKPKPKANITGDQQICLGDTVTLRSSSQGALLWSTQAITASIKISPLVNTTYTLITDLNGCKDTASYSVIVKPSPKLTIRPISASISSGETVSLTALGAGTYLWSPSEGLSCTTCPDPVATPLLTTRYCVKGMLDGCVADTCVIITVKDNCVLEFPNIFSPNGDGANDTWCSKMQECITSQSLSIFDRWGNLSYKSEGREVCWDGGNNSQNSVYTFLLQIIKSDGKIENISGTITLVK